MDNFTCDSPPDPLLLEKFYLVALFGASVAIISLVDNVILFFLLVSRPNLRTSNLFFLTILAFLDTFIALSYIFIMAVGIIKEFVTDIWLTGLWHAYLSPMFAASNVCLAASTFLIVSATLERFLAAVHWTEFVFHKRHRILAIVLPISLAILLNGTVFWEIEIMINENCTNHGRFGLGRSELVTNYYYSTIFAFWIRKIVQIVLPFFSLTYMNIVIVRESRQQEHLDTASALVSASLGQRFTREMRSSVRAATRMLVMVVCTYLLTNIPNLLVASWEFVDFANLHQNHAVFYSFSADVCSILTVFAGAARLPIYCWCNSKIFQELKGLFRFCQSTRSAPGKNRKKISVPLFPNLSRRHRESTVSFGTPLLSMRLSKNAAKFTEKSINRENAIPLISASEKKKNNFHSTIYGLSDEDSAVEIMV